MKGVLSVLLFVTTGFLCLALGNPLTEHGISWNKASSLSVEKEKELGETVFVEIEKQAEIVQAFSVQTYINSLGRQLTSSADSSEFPIRFLVLKESEPNAFAIPGGKVFLTTGLITLVESEEELAGVMCHEIAHVVRRHIAENIEASKRLNLAALGGVLAGMLVGGTEGGAIMTGTLALSESEKLKYTRENESEADRLGLAYMTKAGYDGQGLVTFLKKIHRVAHGGKAFPSYLSTHPGVPTRMSYLETLMGEPSGTTEKFGLTDGLKHVQLRLFILEKGPLAALEHFTRTLEVKPDDGQALLGRALAAMEMGRVKESIEDLKKAHLLDPADPQVLKVLGLGFLRVGRSDEGIRALERSLYLAGSDVETLYYLGQGYQSQNRPGLAVESYLKAEELCPDLPELNRHLGSAYREKGDMGRSHFHYGLYFKQNGDVRYARFHFEKALEWLKQDLQMHERVMKELESMKP